jgi:hypothetical protein
VPKMSDRPSARIFVSCGQRASLGEVAIARKVKTAIEATDFGGRHFEAYVAIDDQALTNVTAGVFARIDRFEYFLFIDFRREEVTSNSAGKAGPTYRGSLFVNQELAIAAFIARKPPISDFLAFQEVGVEDRGGLLEYAQANLKLHPFTPEDRPRLQDLVVAAIKEKVESGKWTVDWRKELALDLVVGPADDARYQEVRPTRYFHIHVKNESERTDATNCRAFLRRWRKLNGRGEPVGDFHSPAPVELKWAGIIESSVVISPGEESGRDFDALFIYHDEPTVATLGLNPFLVDSSRVWETYKLRGTGDYELEYVVRSAEFEPAPITLKLHLSPDLRDTRLVDCRGGPSTPTNGEVSSVTSATSSASSITMVPYVQFGTIQAIVSKGPYPDVSGVVPARRSE